MKINNYKVASSLAKHQSKLTGKNERQGEAHRRIWLRVAAVILIVVFLASECASLIP